MKGQSQFSKGYQEGMRDILFAAEAGGYESVLNWLQGNCLGREEAVSALIVQAAEDSLAARAGRAARCVQE